MVRLQCPHSALAAPAPRDVIAYCPRWSPPAHSGPEGRGGGVDGGAGLARPPVCQLWSSNAHTQDHLRDDQHRHNKDHGAVPGV